MKGRALLVLLAVVAPVVAFVSAPRSLVQTAPRTSDTALYMANTAQSKKRARQNDKKRLVNGMKRSKYRTFMKKTVKAMTNAKPDEVSCKLHLGVIEFSMAVSHLPCARAWLNSAWRPNIALLWSQAKEFYQIAVKTIQKCAAKNVIHPNKGNRLTSRLTLKYNAFRRGEDFSKAISQAPKEDTSEFAKQIKFYESITRPE
jgi:small subunit ribosomal protein S20